MLMFIFPLLTRSVFSFPPFTPLQTNSFHPFWSFLLSSSDSTYIPLLYRIYCHFFFDLLHVVFGCSINRKIARSSCILHSSQMKERNSRNSQSLDSFSYWIRYIHVIQDACVRSLSGGKNGRVKERVAEGEKRRRRRRNDADPFSTQP